MPLYVADTHALIWYLSGSSQLSQPARTAFDEALTGAGQVRIPVIVLAELIMVAEKKRVAINVQHVTDTLRATPGFQFTPLTLETAARIQMLTPLPDIHDRLIVAEALEHQAGLITRDEAITASKLVPVVW